ncbi:MAG: S8 family serine peptidase [Clostridia bacterium]|nr:S8 family serine peptidase [Clostridia bacterium]
MKRIFCIVLSAVLCCMVFQPFAYAQGEVQSGNDKNLETYSARYIVKYADAQPNTGALQKKAKAAFQKAKQQKEETIQTLDAEQEQNERTIMKLRIKEQGMEDTVETTALTDTEEPQKYEMIRLEEAVQPETFMEELQRQSGRKIEYIQPDYVMSLENYEAAAENAQPQKSDSATASTAEAIPQETPAAITQNTDTQVIVALLDTGVDVTHPNLAGHLVEGYDFYHNTSEIKAKEGTLEDVHGTHIAGVIAQTAPNAKIMPLKIFDNGKAYTSDIIRAIRYAEEHGAAIVNCSWGSADNNTALREVMEQSDMFFVCAAGNHRKNLQTTPVYPAAFGLPNMVSVASLNQDLGMSYFSNYGESVDIAAVGRDVESTYPNGETGKMNGTSVSAGFVTGAAAVYAEMYQDTSALKEDMKRSADKLSCLQRKVADGNYLNIENLLARTAGKSIEIIPEDDFDVLGYERTPAENWELFNQSDTVKVAVGIGYSVFLKSDGTVWVCGGSDGDSGEPILIPKQVAGLTNIIDIAAGREFLALYEDGIVYSYNSYNNVAMQVDGLEFIEKIAADNSGHCLALGRNGSVWGWGENSWGQAGGRDVIVEDMEFGAILVGFEYVYSPTEIMKELTYDPYMESFTNARKIYTGDSASYIVDENNISWRLGYRGWGFSPDSTYCYGMQCSENIKEIAGSIDGMRIDLLQDGSMKFYKGSEEIEYDASWLGTVKAISGNTILKDSGTVWTWNYGNTLQPSITIEQITGIDHVVSISSGYGSFDDESRQYHVLMIKDDGSVWGMGCNSSGELGGEISSLVLEPRQIMEAPPIVTGETLIDEQYAASDNPAYQANQAKLESLGWSAYGQQNKTGNEWQSPELGTFDAQTGQLVMKKVGDINTPTEAPPAGLVYSVDKTFTYRQDNWKDDPHVSVWTQHFKGDYEIELKGSFQQTKGQVYYDVQGYRNNGISDKVARYKINPGTNGYINVYNNKLNGGGVTDYPIILNPRENRTIRTKFSSETATYQTFVDEADTACVTTVSGAAPNDTFNMTGWNTNQPGAYMSGIRITAQKQTPQNDTIAAIDSVKLTEYYAVHDIVDDAIDLLSMDTLTDAPEAVTTDLKLLPNTLAGANIMWTSSKPEIISNDGTLTGLPDVDTEVIMTAKLTNPADGFTKYMDFTLLVQAAPEPEAKVLIEEQYGQIGTPFYHMGEAALLQNGWSEYDQQNKSGNNWQSPELGELSAASGQLVVKKTGSTSQPEAAGNTALVYAVDKMFTYRQDNWLGNPRMSMWTQNFKGDYSVEITGSFHQGKGQAYYDMIGATANGNEGIVGRYKVDPGTNGNFSVYNNKLNGGNTMNYTLWSNPTEKRVITTRINSETSEFQTFVGEEEQASATTVSGAEPNDRFSMTGWNKANPGAYLKGIRFSAQKQAIQGNAIVKLDSVRLIEHKAIASPVDTAIRQLSMTAVTDTPDAVKGDLKILPQELAGIPIVWTSSKPELLSNAGKLANRPKADTDVVMTAKFTNPADKFTKYVDFRLTIAKAESLGPLPAVDIVKTENPALYTALKKARSGLDRTNTGKITPAELEQITGTLNLSYAGLQSIAGLQSCKKIHTIYLDHNELTDLSPLRGLTALNTVIANHNNVQTVSSLAGTPLVTLDLEENQITSVLQLSDSATLEALFLGGNQITDATGLALLVNLQTLKIDRNELTNLEFASGMLKLRYLNASGNHISDVTPLKPLLMLTDLRLSNNDITSIEPLQGSFYRYLYLDHNRLDVADNMGKLLELKSVNLWYYPQKTAEE